MSVRSRRELKKSWLSALTLDVAIVVNPIFCAKKKEVRRW
jgi:hypothetical protein